MKKSATWAPDQGPMAPSPRVAPGSGTTSSGSTSIRVPSPWHSGQAPNGELNENDRGSSSSVSIGCSLGQAIFSENRSSRPGSLAGRSTKSKTTSPPARPSAVSTESVSRRLADALTASRSTTTSIVCFFCLSSLGGSSREWVSPLTRARREALGLELAEQVDVLALAAADHRREHLEAGALLEGQHPVDDLLRRLPRDRRAAGRAVRAAGAGVEQPEVVVDLGDRADGRAGVLRRGLLVDRDRRREPLDEVDVGLVHLAEELAGVGRQRLDVAALALGEDRVEREAGLARAGQPGEHDQGVARQLEGDVLEVVLARTPDDELVSHGTSSVGRVRTNVRHDSGVDTSAPAQGWMASCPRPPSSLQIDETLLATTRYLQALTVLDDESVRRPSVLPGWSRAHVVAHLSRNADALHPGARRRSAAGEPASMYASERARATPTSRRPSRPTTSPASSRTRSPRWPGSPRRSGPATADPDAPYARVAGGEATFALHTLGPAPPGRGGDPPRRPRPRLRAVRLAGGLLHRDGPAAPGRAGRAARRLPVDGAVAPPTSTGSGSSASGQGPEIHGTAGDLAWWLVGRGGGRGLTCSSGELPALGRWR